MPEPAFSDLSRPNALARCIGTGSGRFGAAAAVKTRVGGAARSERPFEGDM